MCGVWVGMCACACMWRSEVIGVFLDCSDFLYFRQGILWNPELTDSASLSSHPHPWDPLYLPLKPWVLLQAFNGVLRIWGSSLHACVAILYQHWATSPDHHWICLYWQYWQVSSPVRTMSPGRSTSRFRLYSRQMRHPWGLITDTT